MPVTVPPSHLPCFTSERNDELTWRPFLPFFSYSNGAGPRGFLPSLSGYMLSSAATFAFFMSIGEPYCRFSVLSSSAHAAFLLSHFATGTVIRTDGLTMREWAEKEIREGRAIGAGGMGGSPVLREFERRRAVKEQ